MTSRHTPRLRTIAIPVMFALTTVVAAAAHAHAADIDPMGVGDLMPSPSTKTPAGQGTLFETYSSQSLWMLDSDYGMFDSLDPILESFADICMILVSTIGMACVVSVQWVFQLTSLPELESALTDSLGGAAAVLSATVLPAALVVGMLVAFGNAKNGGGDGAGVSQIMWVMVSAVVSISLLSTPQVWVSGVDTVRTVGAGVTMEAASAGVSGTSADFPFKMDHEPKFTDNGRDNMLRRAADSIWRSQVATPWCIAEFGSFEVCEKFAKGLLDQGTDKDKRKEWLQENVTSEAVGGDSVSWRAGHQPLMRLTVTALALLSVIIFAFLLLRLAYASLRSLIGALMLLFSGVLFASLWVIPGRPRRWGNAWFDQLLARCLESVIATLVLGAVLSVQIATTQMFDVYGWLPTTGLSIATAAVAMQFRAVIAQIFGISSSSSAGAIGGILAYRALSRATGRARSGGIPRAVITRPPGGDNGGNGGDDSSTPPGGGLMRTMRPPVPPPGPVTLSVVRPGPPQNPTTGPPVVPPPRPGGPALPTSSPNRPVLALRSNPQTPPVPPGSPVLRPETGGDPAYGFRRIPPPAAPGRNTVIKGEVLRRSTEPPTYRQPALDGTYPPSRPRPSHPVRPAAARRPAPPVTRRTPAEPLPVDYCRRPEPGA